MERLYVCAIRHRILLSIKSARTIKNWIKHAHPIAPHATIAQRLKEQSELNEQKKPAHKLIGLPQFVWLYLSVRHGCSKLSLQFESKHKSPTIRSFFYLHFHFLDLAKWVTEWQQNIKLRTLTNNQIAHLMHLTIYVLRSIFNMCACVWDLGIVRTSSCDSLYIRIECNNQRWKTTSIHLIQVYTGYNLCNFAVNNNTPQSKREENYW